MDGCKHKIVVCSKPTDFNRLRYESSLCDEFVAFVDDDDVIAENALQICVDKLLIHDADLMFTDEYLLWEANESLTDGRRGRRTYEEIASSPIAAHHLVTYKSSMIQSLCLDMANEFNIGIEWFITNCCMRNGKTIHIPLALYTWTQRYNQHNKVNNILFNGQFSKMKKTIAQVWDTPKGLVPVI